MTHLFLMAQQHIPRRQISVHAPSGLQIAHPICNLLGIVQQGCHQWFRFCSIPEPVQQGATFAEFNDHQCAILKNGGKL